MGSRPAVHLMRRGKVACGIPDTVAKRWTAEPRHVTCRACMASVSMADAEIEQRIQPRRVQ